MRERLLRAAGGVFPQVPPAGGTCSYGHGGWPGGDTEAAQPAGPGIGQAGVGCRHCSTKRRVQAIVQDLYGSADVLELADNGRPVPAGNEV